jgi:ABC-type branched-subunit amino acid transport system substrate-binding protein
MKKPEHLFLTLIFFLLVLFSEPISAEKKSLGVIIPQTGAYAHFGEAARIGLELALKNSKQDYDLLYQDSQYDAAVALKVFTHLLATSNLSAVFVLGSPPASSIVPLAETKSVPVFVWTPSIKITGNKRQVIRLMASAQEQSEVMAKRVKDQGLSKIGFVIAQNEFAQAIRDSFVGKFKKDEILIDQEFAPSEQDFRAFISKLKLSKLDGLGVCLNTGQLSSFVHQLKQQDLSVNIFGCHSMSSHEVANALAYNGYDAWFVEGAIDARFQAQFAKLSSDSSGIWLAAAFHDLGLYLSEYGLVQSVGSDRKIEGSAFEFAAVVRGEDDTFLNVPLRITAIEKGIFKR